MAVYPGITLTQRHIDETYGEAVAMLRGFFGFGTVFEPKREGLRKRTDRITSRTVEDCFRVEIRTFQNKYPGVSVRHFLAALYGGDGDTNSRIGGEEHEIKETLWGGTDHKRSYVLIDAVSLIAAIRKGENFRNGKSARAIMEAALGSPLRTVTGEIAPPSEIHLHGSVHELPAGRTPSQSTSSLRNGTDGGNKVVSIFAGESGAAPEDASGFLESLFGERNVNQVRFRDKDAFRIHLADLAPAGKQVVDILLTTLVAFPQIKHSQTADALFIDLRALEDNLAGFRKHYNAECQRRRSLAERLQEGTKLLTGPGK
ncbi:MAG: hypothetical protein U1E36_09135 [Rickettsiales bacterium]